MTQEFTSRLHPLDAVRAIALCLGVLLHAAMSFLPSPQPLWIVTDNQPSIIPAVLFFAIHMFRMVTFFLIAGFFGAMLLARRGVRMFIKDRWKRIFSVLLIFWPIVFTAIVAVIIAAVWIKTGGKLPKESPSGPSFTPGDFPLTHLWFLWVLSLFYAATLLIRTVMQRIDKRRCLHDLVLRSIGSMMRTPILPLLLAILTAPALFFTKKWMPWFGVPTPDASLYPNVAAIVFFGVAFAIGWLMQSAKDPFSKMTTRWALNLMVAIGATAACLSLRGMAPSTALRGNPLDDCAFALLYALGVWSWTFALIGMSFRFLSKPSVVRRYLAHASYWIYLMHLPIVMAIQVALARTSVHWSLKLTTIVGVTMMLLLVSYHLIVRNTLIGVLLNGKKAKERSEDAPDRSAAPVCAT